MKRDIKDGLTGKQVGNVHDVNYPQWLVDMPKTNFHIHMGGSIRPSTVMELSDKYGIDLGVNSIEELRENIVYKRRELPCLEDYLSGIALCERVLARPEAFSRVAYEIAQDSALQNVRVLELRFGPVNYANGKQKPYEVVEATLDGLARAARDFGMLTGLIICGIRSDLANVAEAADLAANYQDHGVVGYDIAGKEKGHRPILLVEPMKPVLHNFMPTTIHAGEADTVASIAEAVIHLNALRIGHAVTLRESPRLLNYIDKCRLGIEICPTSNVDTGAVAKLRSHPVREYHKCHNLRVSVHPDNPTISDTNITHEYWLLMDQLGFDQADIFKLAKNGIKSLFIDSNTTTELLKEFDAWVDNLPEDQNETKVKE